MAPEAPTRIHAVLTSADAVRAALVELSDESKAAQVARYLRAVPGGYGEGDRFRGVPVPQVRAIAKRAVLDDDELERLVAGPWHEERMAALCVAVAQAKRISRLLGSRRAQRAPDSQAVQEALARREELGRSIWTGSAGTWSTTGTWWTPRPSTSWGPGSSFLSRERKGCPPESAISPQAATCGSGA